jgi:hypothetical protein
MNKLVKILGAIGIHKVLKDKAVKKAKSKLKEKTNVVEHFYISIPQERTWIDLESGINKQDFIVTIIKIKHYIKNFGGSDIKTVDSTEDTKVYFKMPRSAVDGMFKELKRQFELIALGEVKLRDY